MNVVTFGACKTFDRKSPWAAVRKRKTSRSLRNAMPNVAPEPVWYWVGATNCCDGPVYGMSRFDEKLLRPPDCVPTITG